MRKRYIVAISLLVTIIIGAAAVLYFLPAAPLREMPGEEPITRQEATGITVETVAENLSIPWAIDFADNGDIFFTERSGSVRLIQEGELLEEPLAEFPSIEGEGGTLGLALDPDFSANSYVYIYYTQDNRQNRIARFELINNQLRNETLIAGNIPGAFTHNGGRIAFGPDGKLYAGTGDAEAPHLAQDETSLAGKILRIEPDGSVPEDNPNPDSYVYSIGHRNVQGLDWDEDGQLYATEHGPQARDEVNLIEPMANYGWPEVSGEIELESEGDAPVSNYRNPLISSGNNTWAPSGMAIYNQDVLPEEWHGSLLFTGLRSQTLWRYNFEEDSLVALFSDEYGRLRAVRAAPDGTIYLLTSNQDGRGSPEDNDDRILRISPEFE